MVKRLFIAQDLELINAISISEVAPMHRILSLNFGISSPLIEYHIPNAVLIVVPFMLTAATPAGVIFNTLTFSGVPK